jgi:outer membrane lipoprotein SlyB
MEINKTRIHPLVAGAAIAVILVSLTGIAAMTGMLPSSHGGSAPAAEQVAGSVGAAAAASSPAALVEQKPEADQAPTATADKSEAAAEPKQPTSPTVNAKESHARRTARSEPAICHSCGRIESVQAIQQAAQPSGVGIVAGAVLGGVLGNQVGGGNGRKLATVAGAVGGGYAGNEIEKRSRGSTTYQVRVRMEDGNIRSFPFAQQPAWNVGDRVRVVDGHLTSRA